MLNTTLFLALALNIELMYDQINIADLLFVFGEDERLFAQPQEPASQENIQ